MDFTQGSVAPAPIAFTDAPANTRVMTIRSAADHDARVVTTQPTAGSPRGMTMRPTSRARSAPPQRPPPAFPGGGRSDEPAARGDDAYRRNEQQQQHNDFYSGEDFLLEPPTLERRIPHPSVDAAEAATIARLDSSVRGAAIANRLRSGRQINLLAVQLYVDIERADQYSRAIRHLLDRATDQRDQANIRCDELSRRSKAQIEALEIRMAIRHEDQNGTIVRLRESITEMRDHASDLHKTIDYYDNLFAKPGGHQPAERSPHVDRRELQGQHEALIARIRQKHVIKLDAHKEEIIRLQDWIRDREEEFRIETVNLRSRAIGYRSALIATGTLPQDGSPQDGSLPLDPLFAPYVGSEPVRIDGTLSGEDAPIRTLPQAMPDERRSIVFEQVRKLREIRADDDVVRRLADVFAWGDDVKIIAAGIDKVGAVIWCLDHALRSYARWIRAGAPRACRYKHPELEAGMIRTHVALSLIMPKALNGAIMMAIAARNADVAESSSDSDDCGLVRSMPLGEVYFEALKQAYQGSVCQTLLIRAFIETPPHFRRSTTLFHDYAVSLVHFARFARICVIDFFIIRAAQSLSDRLKSTITSADPRHSFSKSSAEILPAVASMLNKIICRRTGDYSHYANLAKEVRGYARKTIAPAPGQPGSEVICPFFQLKGCKEGRACAMIHSLAGPIHHGCVNCGASENHWTYQCRRPNVTREEAARAEPRVRSNEVIIRPRDFDDTMFAEIYGTGGFQARQYGDGGLHAHAHPCRVAPRAGRSPRSSTRPAMHILDSGSDALLRSWSPGDMQLTDDVRAVLGRATKVVIEGVGDQTSYGVRQEATGEVVVESDYNDVIIPLSKVIIELGYSLVQITSTASGDPGGPRFELIKLAMPSIGIQIIESMWLISQLDSDFIRLGLAKVWRWRNELCGCISCRDQGWCYNRKIHGGDLCSTCSSLRSMPTAQQSNPFAPYCGCNCASTAVGHLGPRINIFYQRRNLPSSTPSSAVARGGDIVDEGINLRRWWQVPIEDFGPPPWRRDPRPPTPEGARHAADAPRPHPTGPPCS